MHPARKKNRLKGYSYSQPGAYFVTVCVKDREPILGSVVGGDAHIAPYVQLSRTGTVVEKYLKSIPGVGHYVIMPNHVHLMIHISADNPLKGPMWASAPTEASVPSVVRSWKTLISKELGHSIWQRSYYDHVIRDEQEYNEIAQYIENNPARWCEDRYYSGY